MHSRLFYQGREERKILSNKKNMTESHWDGDASEKNEEFTEKFDWDIFLLVACEKGPFLAFFYFLFFSPLLFPRPIKSSSQFFSSSTISLQARKMKGCTKKVSAPFGLRVRGAKKSEERPRSKRIISEFHLNFKPVVVACVTVCIYEALMKFRLNVMCVLL